MLKRLMDIVISFTGLVIISPLLLLFILSIWLYDFHNPFYIAKRVGKNGYLCLESFRNDQELFNLECWALTCQSFYTPDEWEWIYNHFGYSGDYEFIYFE